MSGTEQVKYLSAWQQLLQVCGSATRPDPGVGSAVPGQGLVSPLWAVQHQAWTQREQCSVNDHICIEHWGKKGCGKGKWTWKRLLSSVSAFQQTSKCDNGRKWEAFPGWIWMGDFKGRNPALRIHLQYFHKDLSFRDGLYNFSYYRNGKIKDPKCSVLWSCRNKCARNLGRFPKCILIHSRLEVVHCKAFSLLDGSKYKLLKNLKILLHPAALRAFQSCVHRRLEGRKAKKLWQTTT